MGRLVTSMEDVRKYNEQYKEAATVYSDRHLNAARKPGIGPLGVEIVRVSKVEKMSRPDFTEAEYSEFEYVKKALNFDENMNEEMREAVLWNAKYDAKQLIYLLNTEDYYAEPRRGTAYFLNEQVYESLSNARLELSVYDAYSYDLLFSQIRLSVAQSAYMKDYACRAAELVEWLRKLASDENLKEMISNNASEAFTRKMYVKGELFLAPELLHRLRRKSNVLWNMYNHLRSKGIDTYGYDYTYVYVTSVHLVKLNVAIAKLAYAGYI